MCISSCVKTYISKCFLVFVQVVRKHQMTDGDNAQVQNDSLCNTAAPLCIAHRAIFGF